MDTLRLSVIFSFASATLASSMFGLSAVAATLAATSTFNVPASSKTNATAKPLAQKLKTASPDMLTFKQWKTNRFFEAKALLAQLNQEIKISEHRHFEKVKNEHLKHRYQQASHNFDVARDLNAHDYFVAYVTENFPDNAKALAFMVKHMSPLETADILIQYQHSLSQSQASAAGSAAGSMGIPSKSLSAAAIQAAKINGEFSPTLADFNGRLEQVHRRVDDDPIRETDRSPKRTTDLSSRGMSGRASQHLLLISHSGNTASLSPSLTRGAPSTL